MSKKYEAISKALVENVGGQDNILFVTHCATRLRLVLKDKTLAKMDQIENIEHVKGVFVAGDQLQVVFGAGLVNNIYDEFVVYTGNKTGDELRQTVSQQKQNPFQRFIKAISDVFIEIMPSILAAALLMGLSSLLSTKGLFGPESIVEMVTCDRGSEPDHLDRLIRNLCLSADDRRLFFNKTLRRPGCFGIGDRGGHGASEFGGCLHGRLRQPRAGNRQTIGPFGRSGRFPGRHHHRLDDRLCGCLAGPFLQQNLA